MNFERVNFDLCVSVEAVKSSMEKQCVVGFENIIWNGLHRNRNSNSTLWAHHPDPTDARRKWLVISALPERVQNVLKQAHGNDLEHAYYMERLPNVWKQGLSQEDYTWLRNHRYGFTADEAGDMALGASILRWVLRKEWWYAIYIESKLKAFAMVAKVIESMEMRHFKCTNGRVLERKALRYGADGLSSLVPATFGNSNALKTEQEGRKKLVARIVTLCADPRKLTFVKVAEVVNGEYEKFGLMAPMHAESVRLIAQEYKHLWYRARHGEKVYSDKMERVAKRRRAAGADEIWYFDGFTVQLKYWDADRKRDVSDLYVVAVWDAYTDKWVGWSIGATETAQLVQAAFRSAFARGAGKPQWISYDNGGANKSSEVQQLMDRVAKHHFPTMPYNGRSKPIEARWGRFESGFLRHYPNFKGGNITSPSLAIKANPDYMAKQRKDGKLPTMAEAIAQLEQALELWNYTADKRGRTPMEKYAEGLMDRPRIGYDTLVEAFWVERKKSAKYEQGGLTIEIEGEKYTYEVENAEGVADLDWRDRYLGDSFRVRYNPDDRSTVVLYDEEGNKVAVANRKWEAPLYPGQSEIGDMTKVRADLAARQAKRVRDQIALVAMGQVIEDDFDTDLNIKTLHKDAYNRMEQAMQDEQLEQDARPAASVVATEQTRRPRVNYSLHSTEGAWGQVIED